MAKKKSRIKRGSLIKYPLENIRAECFEAIRKELKDILHKQPGIYAFYEGDKVVRVGLTGSLYGRIYGQWKSKKLKWDKFSIFVVRNIKYLRDLETAIVRIAKPKGNKQVGRVPSEYHYYLKRLLRDKVKAKRKILRRKIKTKDKEIKNIEKEIKQIVEAIT